jgi:4-amino-4-deoxy-L-arabinose transferase-like glycosyltransferase
VGLIQEFLCTGPVIVVMTDNLKSTVARCAASRWFVPGVVLLLTVVAAWLRLYRLGEITMRMDEGNGWGIWKAGATIADVLSGKTHHSEKPLCLVSAMGLAKMLGLPLSFFSYRLAAALVGTLAIPLAYLCGRLLGGRGLGCIAALLLALNPVHVQCSREMYPYVYAVTGAFAATAAVLIACATSGMKKRATVALVLLSGVGFSLLIYSLITAWPFAVLAGGLLVALLLVNACRRQASPWLVVGILLVLVIVGGGPAWTYVSGMIDKGGITKFGQADYHKSVPLFSMDGLRFVTNFAWGIKPLALAFTAIVLSLSAWAFWDRRKDLRYIAVLFLVVAGFLLTMVMRQKTGNPFHTRFLVPIMPCYLLLVSVGVLQCIQKFRLPKGSVAVRGVAKYGVLAIACALLFQPLSWVLASNGQPPFKDVTKWADANLAVGAPVLCDRYYTAWNEFRWNAPTNTFFMSTVPNEPPDYYPKSQFRERSEKFFIENLDAALYEQRMFWTRFGMWAWPHEHFARKQEFFDESTWKLHNTGLSYRNGGRLGVTRESLTTTVYYNTEADFAQIAKKRGTKILAVYGRGWTYRKGQQYLDFRVMGAEASVDLYVFGDAPVRVQFVIKGVAAGGDMSLSFNKRLAKLPGGKPLELPIDGIVCTPGKNVIPLKVASRADGASFIALGINAKIQP